MCLPVEFVLRQVQFTSSLTESDVQEDVLLPLQFVKFQTVHSITVSSLARCWSGFAVASVVLVN